MRIFTFLLICLSLISCSENNNKNQQDTVVNQENAASLNLISGTGDIGEVTTSKIITLTVQNTGSAASESPLFLSLTGSNPADFSIIYQSGCNTVIAATKRCTMKISFSAVGKTAGIYSADLNVGNLISIPLTATIPQPPNSGPISSLVALIGTVDSSSGIDYGDFIGTQSSLKTIIIKNTGTAPVIVNSELSNTNFSMIFNQCNNRSLTVNGTCQIRLQFSAAGKTPQVYTGSLNLGSLLSVPLTAEVLPPVTTTGGTSTTGGSSGGPVVSLQILENSVAIPNPLDYGSLHGTQSLTKILYVKNTGTSTVTVTASLDNTNFSMAFNQCNNRSLAVNGTCQIRLSFTASGKTPQLYTGSLNFTAQNLSYPIQATVSLPPNNYNLSINQVQNGTITGASAGQILAGTSLSLQAVPDQNYEIDSWTGDAIACGSSLTCPITMNSNKVIGVNFKIKKFLLTINTTLNGSISGASNILYDYNTVLNLTANPNQNYDFAGWTGDASSCGLNINCEITMTSDLMVGAIFSIQKFALNIDPTVNGSINGALNGQEFDYGTNVSLSAIPSQHYQIEQWTGDAISCGSSDNCVVNMDSVKNIGVTFSPIEYQITFGSVTNGNISGATAGIYNSGTEIILTANPSSNYAFNGWVNVPECSTNPCTLVVTKNYSNISANFVFSPPLTATITASSALEYSQMDTSNASSITTIDTAAALTTNTTADLATNLTGQNLSGTTVSTVTPNTTAILNSKTSESISLLVGTNNDQIDINMTKTLPYLATSVACSVLPSSISSLVGLSCSHNSNPAISFNRSSLSNGNVSLKLDASNGQTVNSNQLPTVKYTISQVTNIGGVTASFNEGGFTPIVFNGWLYFQGIYGTGSIVRVYKYCDGSASCGGVKKVAQVSNINASVSDSPLEFIIYNNALYFTANMSNGNRHIFRYCDGSASCGGVQRLGVVSQVSGSIFSDDFPGSLIVNNNYLYFTGKNNQGRYKVYRYCDGGVCGTKGITQISNTNSGQDDNSNYGCFGCKYLQAYNGSIYFSAKNSVDTFASIYKYCDGSASCGGSVYLRKQIPHLSTNFNTNFNPLFVYNNWSYFTLPADANTRTYKYCDGSANCGGVESLQKVFDFGYVENVNSTVFNLQDGYAYISMRQTSSQLFQIHKYCDGSAACGGQPSVKQVTQTFYGAGYVQNPVFNGEEIFYAVTNENPTKLYKTCVGDTCLNKNIAIRISDTRPGSYDEPRDLVFYNGNLYFTANTPNGTKFFILKK